MSKRALISGVALAAIAVVAPGCGGNDPSTPTTTLPEETSVSINAYLAEANRVCREGNSDMVAALDDVDNRDIKTNKDAAYYVASKGKWMTNSETAKVVSDVVVPMTTDQIDALEGLGLPSGGESQVTEILAKARVGLRKLRNHPDSYAGRTISPFLEFRHQASAFGLRECADLLAADAGPGASTGVPPLS